MANPIYDPNANWQDVPDALRTPRQNAEMFTDFLYYGTPFVLIIVGIVLLIAANDMPSYDTFRSEGKRNRFWLRFGGIFGILIGSVCLYRTWWVF